MQIVPAEGGLLDEILDGTYPVWGEGLDRGAFGRWNRAQMDTPWGRGHLGRVALVDETGLLASAKRYELTFRLRGKLLPVLGIGAVFTPADRRGRGYARQLIDGMIAATRGTHALALLFSEIGSSYYERLGFQIVPQSVASIETDHRPGAPAVLMRSGEAADLAAIAEIAARADAGMVSALERPAELIAFFLTRKRLHAGLGPAGLRSVEFFVTEEGSRPVAYLVITRGPHGVTLEDFGDRDPSGARVGAMLQVLAARTPAEPPARLRAWVPPEGFPPQVRVIAQGPAEEIMMLRPIGAGDLELPEAGQTKYAHLYTF
jgi:GNAT superfamily N-acetyltransferase